MKKITLSFMTALLLLFLSCTYVSAEAPEITLDADLPYAGSTWTVTLCINGDGICGMKAKYSVSDGVMLESVSLVAEGSWTVISENGGILVYSNSDGTAIFKNTAFLSFAFSVADGKPENEITELLLSDIELTDGTNDFYPENVSVSRAIARPKSRVADIESLNIAGIELDKAFSADDTEYSANVANSVERLELNITLADANAQYTVTGAEPLEVGENTVTVKVTAEAGNEKEYRITVTRDAPPNTNPVNEARLKSIIPSVGMLSPIFDKDIDGYILYVPNECGVISFETAPVDDRATVGSCDFVIAEGENSLTLICVAADGETEKIYNITVMRMPKYNGNAPIVTEKKQNNNIFELMKNTEVSLLSVIETAIPILIILAATMLWVIIKKKRQ